MRSISISIPDDAADKLRELARHEFRGPRQQAAVLVLEGLSRAALDLPPLSGEGAESSGDKPNRDQVSPRAERQQ
jgi:hypothetical protein